MTKALTKGSIRRRLVLQLAGIAALLSLAFFLAVRAVAEQAAKDTQDNILAASATSIADALYSERGFVRLELPYSALSMLGTISEDRVFYRVVVDDDTLTGYDDLPAPEPWTDSRENKFSTLTYRGETVRSVAVTRAVSTGSQITDVMVIVAQTRLGLEAISTKITATATAVGAGFFIVATALSLLAAQSALLPLNRLAQSVARRGMADLRPVVTETPAELVPLVQSLNNFMSRLRASLTRSEDFIAEAAHRVRTPLATVRTQAEVVHRRLTGPNDKKALREMIRAIDESSRSAGQLLDHAMVTFRTDHLETSDIDLGDMIRDVCDRLFPTADLKDIQITLDCPEQPLPFSGDPILLQNALRNILDNAIKYSPADSKITVRMTANGAYRIDFSDQGRGFGDANLTQIVARFERGSNVGDIVGSGLGLTIADEVARAHGGSLEISSNSGGQGACVTVILPLS